MSVNLVVQSAAYPHPVHSVPGLALLWVIFFSLPGPQSSKTKRSQWSYVPAGLTHINLPYAIHGHCLPYILKFFVKSILSYLQGNIS